MPISEAPVVGSARASRIIKTHFPADALPFDERARYIYVARHPVSCFASCVDFLRGNLGVFMPGLATVEAWYTSPDLMWWGPWTRHVEGWWAKAQEHPNVLFVTFEEMKADLAGVVARVADHLGVDPLSDEETAAVVEKCGFAYMRDHSIAFEMHPPHLLSVDGELFASGTANRHEDVPAEVRDRISAWVTKEMEGGSFPLSEIYPAD